MNLGKNRCCSTNIYKAPNVGPQGAIGLYGVIGEKGYTGSTGSTGPAGHTGLCYRGYKGAKGPIGPQGGLTGDTGPVGPAGSAGSTNAQNVNFKFTIKDSTTYDNTGYKNLIQYATTTTTPSNTINLSGGGTYMINYEINENWNDSTAKFYVSFNSSTSTVFNNITSLALNTNGTNLYGIGNDYKNFFTSGPYSIELMQSTNSTPPIDISGKIVNFSITFVKIS